MGVKGVYIGQLRRRVTIFHTVGTNANATGETQKTPTEIGQIQAKIEDKGGHEEEDGKTFYLSNRIYIIRFVDQVWKKGQEMFIRDEDGDWQIYGIELLGTKEFLKLKTSKAE